MRLSTSMLALVCATLAAGCGGEPADGSPRELVLPVFVSSNTSEHFGTALDGDAERPVPVDTRARGNAVFTLSDDGTTLHYKLIVANIRNVTQSHIHVGPEQGTGPVVVFLFGFVAGGVTENGVLAEGDIKASNLIARPAIGFGATMPELVAAMTNGGAYVNVHTVAWPAGEIRGQINEHGPTQ